MLVLGIDPGSVITGYGIVERTARDIRYISDGIVKTSGKTMFPARLLKIFANIGSVIERYSPDVVAIENLFVSKNARSSLLLGHARGVVILAASLAKIEIAEYTPAEVKQAVVGQGHATKDQVQHMVKALLRLSHVTSADSSDALAVAICHCHTARISRLIRENLTK